MGITQAQRDKSSYIQIGQTNETYLYGSIRKTKKDGKYYIEQFKHNSPINEVGTFLTHLRVFFYECENLIELNSQLKAPYVVHPEGFALLQESLGVVMGLKESLTKLINFTEPTKEEDN